MVAHYQWVGDAGEHTLLVLLHSVFLSAHIHNDIACLWGKDGEVGTVLHIKTWRETSRKIGFRRNESCLICFHLRTVGKLPPVEVHQFHTFLSGKYKVEVASAANGFLNASLQGCPICPATCITNPHLCNFVSLDTVETHFHHATPHTAADACLEEAGLLAEVNLAHLYIISVVYLGDIYTIVHILF